MSLMGHHRAQITHNQIPSHFGVYVEGGDTYSSFL